MDDTKSRRLTTKQQKAAARQALKSRRSGRATSGLDALDESEGAGVGNNKNDNVVDTYTEEEYKEYVERQLQREDFVVDDGKLISLLVLLFGILGL